MIPVLRTPVDTLRVLVDWKCNLTCIYCCNEQARFRSAILPVALSSINFTKYKTVCISGGEPLLFPGRVVILSEKARAAGAFVVLYTNGTLMTPELSEILMLAGVQAINVGLHVPESLERLIRKVGAYTADSGMQVRYHLCDSYRSLELEKDFPRAAFRYWAMDDCDRDNEERVVLAAEPRGTAYLMRLEGKP